MDVKIRQYKSSDYDGLKALYEQSELYGGEFSESRDSKEVLDRVTAKDPYAVIVAEAEGGIVGTVSLIENERVAWLYRFCVAQSADSEMVAKALFDKANDLLARRGHRQVLVYSDPRLQPLTERYTRLGFTRGSDYSCFWKDI